MHDAGGSRPTGYEYSKFCDWSDWATAMDWLWVSWGMDAQGDCVLLLDVRA